MAELLFFGGAYCFLLFLPRGSLTLPAMLALILSSAFFCFDPSAQTSFDASFQNLFKGIFISLSISAGALALILTLAWIVKLISSQFTNLAHELVVESKSLWAQSSISLVVSLLLSIVFLQASGVQKIIEVFQLVSLSSYQKSDFLNSLLMLIFESFELALLLFAPILIFICTYFLLGIALNRLFPKLAAELPLDEVKTLLLLLLLLPVSSVMFSSAEDELNRSISELKGKAAESTGEVSGGNIKSD